LYNVASCWLYLKEYWWELPTWYINCNLLS